MMVLVSPSGTLVSVDAGLGERLRARGWSVPGRPEPKQAPVKRKPGRPRKSD